MRIIEETYMLKDELELRMHVEKIDGEACDTECFIDGSWCVSGDRRKEFAEKLESLVQEYCI